MATVDNVIYCSILKPSYSTIERDGFWNGVAQWFGISRSVDLNEILPNRNTFSSDLLTGVDLFNNVENPTLPPISAPTPSQSPTGQPSTSPTPAPQAQCIEDPDTMFYLGKDENGAVLINNCAWLEQRRDKEKLCRVETHYHTVGHTDTIIPPPQVACPITCENYCDPCFENARTYFFLKKKYDGSPVFRTCNQLSRLVQNDIDRICSRSESYQDYPIPSSACPITCGVSDCFFQDENNLVETLVELNVDLVRQQSRNASIFFNV